MTDEQKKSNRNQFWGRVLIVAFGVLALAQIIPVIWRWFST